VRKADHDGPRKVFHHRAHASDAKQHQQDARHHRAHEKAVHAVFRDDARYDHDEGPGGAADLRF